MWKANTSVSGGDKTASEDLSTEDGKFPKEYTTKHGISSVNYSTMSPFDNRASINASDSDNEKLNNIVYSSFIAMDCLGISAILLNIFFLVAVQLSKERYSPFHRFMKSLSVSDIMASLMFMLTQHWRRGPFSFINPSEHFLLSELLPYIFRGMPWMFFTCYLMTLTCLSINQYVAVCKPWKYSMISSQKWVTGILCSVWLLSSLQIILPSLVLLVLGCTADRGVAFDRLYIISNLEMQVWMVIFIMTTIVSITLNFLIYRKIRELKWKRRMSLTSQETLNIRMKQEAFITITMLLVTAILLRFPFPVVSIAILQLEYDYDLGQRTSVIINAVVLLLLFINFFTDPIIYTLRMKEARQLYKACFGKAYCCVRSSENTSRPLSMKATTSALCCSSSRSFDGVDPRSRMSLTGERTEITMAFMENGNKYAQDSFEQTYKDSDNGNNSPSP